jgi:hypothetical protein
MLENGSVGSYGSVLVRGVPDRPRNTKVSVDCASIELF